MTAWDSIASIIVWLFIIGIISGTVFFYIKKRRNK